MPSLNDLMTTDVNNVTKARTVARAMRLFLVDDEPMVWRGLELLFGHEADLTVCGHASSASETLERLPALAPDLAIVDLSLRSETGFDLLRQLRRLSPGLGLLVFSMHNEISFVRAAFEAGAQAYVTKEEGADTVLEAVRSVAAGKTYLSPAIAARMPYPLATFDSLKRENQA